MGFYENWLRGMRGVNPVAADLEAMAGEPRQSAWFEEGGGGSFRAAPRGTGTGAGQVRAGAGAPEAGRSDEALQRILGMLGQSAGASRDMAQMVYGARPEVPEGAQERIDEADRVIMNNQPHEAFAAGSLGSDMRGNPFGLDTRGINTGLANFGLGLVNRGRRKRAEEAMEGSIEDRRAMASQAAYDENMMDWMSRVAPDLAKNLSRFQADRELIREREERDGNLADQRQGHALERLDRQAEHRENLERLRARLRDPETSADGRTQTRNRVFTELRYIAENEVPEFGRWKRDLDQNMAMLQHHLRNRPRSETSAQFESWQAEKKRLEAHIRRAEFLYGRAQGEVNRVIDRLIHENELTDDLAPERGPNERPETGDTGSRRVEIGWGNQFEFDD